MADESAEVAEVAEPVAALTFEAPDVTARFAVAQLEELNERIAALTALATEKTDATLAKVHHELRRITSLREVDLTEQAAGHLRRRAGRRRGARPVRDRRGQVTDDLRMILKTRSRRSAAPRAGGLGG